MVVKAVGVVFMVVTIRSCFDGNKFDSSFHIFAVDRVDRCKDVGRAYEK